MSDATIYNWLKQERIDREFGAGTVLSLVGCVLDLGVQHGVVKRSGAYLTYGDERLGQGRAKAKVCLEERPELVEEIAREVREGVEGAVVATESPAALREDGERQLAAA
jgi:recombination protein RecA